MFKRILNWLELLTREIPPPKSTKQASVSLIQRELTPQEQEIIAQAEQALRKTELRSQAIIQAIQNNPVIVPAPEPVQQMEVPEISEVPAFGGEPLSRTEILATIEPIAEEPTPTGWAAIEPGEEQIQGMEIPDFGVSFDVSAQPNSAQSNEVLEVPAPEPTKAPRQKTSSSRSKQVEEHLEKAWSEGFRTYDQLMNYVELATGKGCSKRVIAAWKKSRETVAA